MAERTAYAALPPDPFHAFRVIENPWQRPPLVEPLLREPREVVRSLLQSALEPVQQHPAILPVAAEPGCGKSHLLRWALHEAAGSFRRALIAKPSPDAPLAEQLLAAVLGDLRRPDQRPELQRICRQRLAETLVDAEGDPSGDKRKHGILDALVRRDDVERLARELAAGGDFSALLTAGNWRWTKAQWALVLASWDSQEARWPAVGALLGRRGDVPGWPGAFPSASERLYDVLRLVAPYYIGLDDIDSWLDVKKEDGGRELCQVFDGLVTKGGAGVVLVALHLDASRRYVAPPLDLVAKLRQRVGFSGPHGWERDLRLHPTRVPVAVLEETVRTYVAAAGGCAKALQEAWAKEPSFPIPSASIEELGAAREWNLRSLMERLSALYRRHARPPRTWDIEGPGVWAEAPPSRIRHVRPEPDGTLSAQLRLAPEVQEVKLRAGIARNGARLVNLRDGLEIGEEGRPEDLIEVRAHRGAPVLRLLAGDRALQADSDEFVAEGRVRLVVEARPVPVDRVTVVLDGERYLLRDDGLELADGRHELAAEAVDRTGAATRATWKVTVDRSPPAVVLSVEGREIDGAESIRLRQGQALEAVSRTRWWTGDVEWVLDGGAVRRGRRIELPGPSHEVELRPLASPAGAHGEPRRVRVEVRTAPPIRFEVEGEPVPLQAIPALLGPRYRYVQPGARLSVRAAGGGVEGVEVSLYRGVWLPADEGFRLPPGQYAVQVRATEGGLPVARDGICFVVVPGLRLLRPVLESEDPIDRARALSAWLAEQPGSPKRTNEAKQLAQCWGRGPEPSPDVVRPLAQRLVALERAGLGPPRECGTWPPDPLAAVRQLAEDLDPELKKKWGTRLGETIVRVSLAGIERLAGIRADALDLSSHGLSTSMSGTELECRLAAGDGTAVRIQWEESGAVSDLERTLVLRLTRAAGKVKFVAVVSHGDVAFLAALADRDAASRVVGGTKSAQPLVERLADAPDRDLAEYLARRPIWDGLCHLTRRFHAAPDVVA